MLIRQLCRWLSPLAVLAVATAVARAAYDEEAGPTRSPPVLAYFLAFLFTVLAVVIVCMPSRKS
jgi:hypothetical protein